jgi:hypothetical protein
MAGPWEKFQKPENGPWSAFAKPEKSDPYAETAKEQSTGENFLAGVGGSMKGLYLGAKQMLGAADQGEIDDHKAAMKGLGSTTSGTVGQFAGIAVPAAATALIPGANTLTGSALIGVGFGALEPTAKDESRLQNAAIGGMAGAAGQKIAGAIGRINKPVQSVLTPEKQILAQRAEQMGIPLNIAQQTGSRPLQIIDSVLDNMPLTADRQMAMKDAAKKKFNAAVGQTFGATDERLTPDAIKASRDRIGQQFTDLAERNTLKFDNQAVQQLTDLTENLNKFDTPEVAKIASNYIDDLMSKTQNGEVAGEAYRKFDSALGRKIRSTSNGDLRNALGQIQMTVRETMDRSISAGDAEAWKQARRQYASLMDVAPIAAKDVEGNVSAKLLWNKVNGKNTKLREVAEVGKAFANDIPDSGTAQRAFYQRLIENPLTALWQQGVGGLSMPLQSSLNSKAGQRYFTQGLLDVSPQAARLGKSGVIATPIGLLQIAE